MSMPSPFEMGRAIGGNISGGVREGSENSRLDQILQQAQASGDPAQVQNLMNQIITQVSPEKRPMVMQALQNRHEQIKSNIQKQQQESYYKSIGKPPGFSSLPDTLKKELLSEESKERLSQNRAQSDKVRSHIEGMTTGLQILNRQRQLIKSGNLGPKFSVTGTSRKLGSTMSNEGIRDRAEYEQLGKSLISLSTTIPIRNRLEFEVLANKLHDPTMKQEEIEGVLKSLELILNSNLSQSNKQITGNQENQQVQAQMQPDKQQFVKGQTATNPQTGQTITFDGEKWE